MNRERFRILAGVVTVTVIVLSSLAFTVRERHAVLVTRFGKPLRTELDPGLHCKLPWPIDRATIIDQRTRVFETRQSETLTGDSKNIILLTYASWRVGEPLLFYRAVGTIEAADRKLDGLISDAKMKVMGGYELSALASTSSDDLRVEEIEGKILAAAGKTAREKYGIEIDQVGFKRLSLPEENTQKVFEQMRQERKQYAERERAEGLRRKKEIESETDVEATRIVAQADRDALEIRGGAEAEAARIIAEAVGENVGLYEFLRSLDAAEASLNEQTTLIMRTDSLPFQLLKGPAELLDPDATKGKKSGE